ncbi:PSD1 and planctomycete cytochrome C domain-containing protein [Paludisphaera mucosa]|uniref:PSD1 and planctomycete cytochrome C domain-containing protein n=1 Tax=Paludisphaera mucosa TaxID=3030827 RepID=A0ABT6FKX7_9BACT|nr:PSD1 and planctomycete cytochrome C domain-containing protein [Paludisphaera mucosa]MDG3008221.1 PSD1 and planctomycete cytochrome C domain-containing protein [Paludisphaera mucosa]
MTSERSSFADAERAASSMNVLFALGGSSLQASFVIAFLALLGAAVHAGDGAEREAFFEAKVRPILADRCFGCHSAKAGRIKGNLALDSLEGLFKGGDLGPAVQPGRPEESLLVQAIGYQDDSVKMPPKQKLSEEEIAVLRRWVAEGPTFPKSAASPAARAPGIDFARARGHWAYQPFSRREPPPVEDEAWPSTPVDPFVLAKLEAAGLSPSPPADRRTLLRRAYYDLIGLPPTAEEIAAFEADRSDDAFAKVVDRLLASPRYGERWGRHWLDVARYADSKDGVLMYGDDRIRPYAYTYRDYVVRSFNEDAPFDRMIREQLAADAVAPKDEPWRLAAMGFLTLGRAFDNNVHDQIDDKIDVVSRGLLGLTVACARCHDHKYDPIPTADYYSLYGVFAGAEAPLELPAIDDPERTPDRKAFEDSANVKRSEIRRFLDDQYVMLSEEAARRSGDYLIQAATTPPDPLETAVFFMSLDREQLRPPLVARWRRLLKRRADPADPVFGPLSQLMKLDDEAVADRSAAILASWAERPAGTGLDALNPLVSSALKAGLLRCRSDVARAYADLFRRTYEESRSAPDGLADDAARRQILDVIRGSESPSHITRGQTVAFMSRVDIDAYGPKIVELDRMTVKASDPAPRAMVLVDAEQPYAPRVFVRGNPAQPGDAVPRRFLHILSGDDAKPFARGGGRLDLAEAIADPKNPLTGRVIVNRVWMHHFGEPLVSTPSDFGERSTPPTHPELLDDLAARFVEGGWSVKSLHRLIVLSSTYRQSSADRPECRKVDPENRLMWRANRRRLDFEAMRDTLLAVSGRLDATMYGRPVDVANDPGNARRSVYGLIDRQSFPAVFRAFDLASPDVSAERRPMTTVPQQALFGMNAPLVAEQAKALAARPEIAAADPRDAVRALYRLILARAAGGDEVESAARFLRSLDDDPGEPGLAPLAQLAQVLLISNEAMFVD